MRRRDLVSSLPTGAAAVLTARRARAAAPHKPEGAAPRAGSANPITEENQRPGTRDWMLQHPRVTPPSPPWHQHGGNSPMIEAYTSQPSVLAGESLTLQVSTNPPAPYRVAIFRCGYYDGAGARQIEALGPFVGTTQPYPTMGSNRVMDCAWKPSLTVQTGADWPSGVYLAKLSLDPPAGAAPDAHADSYAIFVVRDDRRCDFLIKVNDMNWQAYNRWPDRHSLYCDGKTDANWVTGIDASLNRPYMKHHAYKDQPLSIGSGEWFCYEFPLAYWMESLGYDVSYVSCWDVHHHPETLARAKGFLSIGHDEYWTQPMFDAVKTAIREQGLSALFLCGNSLFGRLLTRPDQAGRGERIITREGRFKTEDQIMGVRSPTPIIGGADWTCTVPEHWVFAGTGMRHGDSLPAMVAWEFHGDAIDLPGLEVIAAGETDARNAPVHQGTSTRGSSWYQASVYLGPKDNVVFSASTLLWAYGLAAPPGFMRTEIHDESWDRQRQKIVKRRRGPDARVQRITRNLLERILHPQPAQPTVARARLGSLPVSLPRPATVRFTVRDGAGAVVKEGSQDLPAGKHTLPIDFAQPGRHIVSLFVNGKVYSRRIVHLGAAT